jgi:hypothetical protein
MAHDTLQETFMWISLRPWGHLHDFRVVVDPGPGHVTLACGCGRVHLFGTVDSVAATVLRSALDWVVAGPCRHAVVASVMGS